MKIKQVLFTKLINLVLIVHSVHSVNSQGIMNLMGKVGGLESCSSLEQMKKKNIKNMASAMFTCIMSERTGETDRMKADTVGRALFSMIPLRP